MRLTRAGIGIAFSALLSFAIARLFGADELLVLAAIQLAALVVALLLSGSTRLDLAISRTANPARLRAGTPARVDVSIANRSNRSTPVLLAVDHIGGTPGASLHLAPIKGGAAAPIAYRLPTTRRGLIDVGPLDLRFGDPLGLTRGTVRASDRITLVVHPELLDLGVLHAIAGHDPTADQQPIRALASGGDEFFALRPYVIGDELRRVHWRASARTGELVVRQDERPRTGRVTVLLDLRRTGYDDAGFERAVSVALSALYAGWRGDDALRFVTTGHSAISDIRSRHELDAIDEQLATITTTESASLVRSIEGLTKVGRGGTLVVITGTPTSELSLSLDRARRTFGAVTTVICQPFAEPPSNSIVYDGSTPLAPLWREQMASDTSRTKAAVRR